MVDYISNLVFDLIHYDYIRISNLNMWGLMITSYCCIAITFILLFISGLQGYFQFYVYKASHHDFALITAIFYMFTETLIMFYFIGSGTAIKNNIIEEKSPLHLYENIKKTKMKLFPHLTLNMLLMGTVFILSGAVHVGSMSEGLRGVLFICAFIHFLYTTQLQHNGFKENIEILIKLADLKPL